MFQLDTVMFRLYWSESKIKGKSGIFPVGLTENFNLIVHIEQL